MDNNDIRCKVCGSVIPGVFDNEQEVAVPQVASLTGGMDGVSAKKFAKTKRSTATQKTILIYLTCINFHGPYAYEIKTK
jgi:hypothetical protein